jgi:HEAT repeat protein
VKLADAAALAQGLKDERKLAELRAAVADELEEAVRNADYRVRAVGYRAIGQLRFTQRVELLRRGLEDESPAVRGSALLSLEAMSRGHPGPVNQARPLLHALANADPNAAVRRLAVLCLKNGSAAADTITLLDFIARSEEEERELRAAAGSVRDALKKKSRTGATR